MTLFAAVVLFATAGFSFVAWPAFLRRVSVDARARDEQGRPTRFLLVHRALVAVALALALSAVVAATLLLTAG